MIKKGFFIFICLFTTSLIFCQSGQISNKREAFDLKLFVNDSLFYNAPMVETKYVINDTIIQIFPGEKLYVDADISGDKLISFKVVPEIINKNKTLIIEFHQEINGKNHEQMMLTIDNPFDKELNYKAMINLMKNQKWVRTSVVPIMAGLKSIEMWPDIITSIALTSFEFKSK
jgi:hypothetical protein